MTRHIAIVPILACLLIASGCSENKKICEHARGVVVKEVEKVNKIDESIALPEEKASAKKRSEERVAAVQTQFVDKCMEFDDVSIKCMKRIGDLIAINDEESQRFGTCVKRPSREEFQACAEKLRAEMKEKRGDCEDVMKKLMDEYAPPSPSSPE